MATQMSRAFLTLLVIFGVSHAAELAGAADRRPQPQAQGDRKDQKSSSGHQRTAWWKDEKARAEIGLTADQASAIDRIFRGYIEKAKPLREEVNTLEKALSETMKANADVSV